MRYVTTKSLIQLIDRLFNRHDCQRTIFEKELYFIRYSPLPPSFPSCWIRRWLACENPIRLAKLETQIKQLNCALKRLIACITTVCHKGYGGHLSDSKQQLWLMKPRFNASVSARAFICNVIHLLVNNISSTQYFFQWFKNILSIP